MRDKYLEGILENRHKRGSFWDSKTKDMLGRNLSTEKEVIFTSSGTAGLLIGKTIGYCKTFGKDGVYIVRMDEANGEEIEGAIYRVAAKNTIIWHA